jgi:hypothetical protein
VRQWLEETYPAIAARARREGAEIYWCDETGVAADEQPRYGYAREGDPATMEVPARTSGSIRSRRSATRGRSGS